MHAFMITSFQHIWNLRFILNLFYKRNFIYAFTKLNPLTPPRVGSCEGPTRICIIHLLRSKQALVPCT